MHRNTRIIGATAVLALMYTSQSAYAAAALVEVRFVSVDAGGATQLVGGTITASITVGQPDLGTVSGGGFEFVGGVFGRPTQEDRPAVESWTSERVHDQTVRPIALDPDDNVAVSEPRFVTNPSNRFDAPRRQLGGIRTIRVRFSTPVRAADGDLDPADVAVRDYDGNGFTPDDVALEDAGRTLVIRFDAETLPNARRYTIDVAPGIEGESGEALVGDTDCHVRALVGDVDNSGTVNALDVIEVSDRLGDPVDDQNARFDVFPDDAIDFRDAVTVLRFNGTSAP